MAGRAGGYKVAPQGCVSIELCKDTVEGSRNVTLKEELCVLDLYRAGCKWQTQSFLICHLLSNIVCPELDRYFDF